MDDNLSTYHRIYDQLYEDPFVPVEDIALKLEMFFLTWPGEAKKVDTILRYLEKYGYCTGLRSLILSTSPRNLDLDEVKTFVEQ
jgi:hypothetical protein